MNTFYDTGRSSFHARNFGSIFDHVCSSIRVNNELCNVEEKFRPIIIRIKGPRDVKGTGLVCVVFWNREAFEMM